MECKKIKIKTDRHIVWYPCCSKRSNTDFHAQMQLAQSKLEALICQTTARKNHFAGCFRLLWGIQMLFVRPDKALNPQHQQRQQSFRAQTSGRLADTRPRAPCRLSESTLIEHSHWTVSIVVIVEFQKMHPRKLSTLDYSYTASAVHL